MTTLLRTFRSPVSSHLRGTRPQHVARYCFSTIAASQSPQSSTPAVKKLQKKNLAMGPRRLVAAQSEDAPRYESDLVVVLDMDECLIHSQFLSAQSSNLAHQVLKPAEEWKTGDDKENQDVVDSFQVRLPDGDMVHVNQRPHLHEFLARVSEKFETHVFTAAMEIYAKPVLDTLDPHQTRFTKRWYRESCVQTQEGAFVKNLGVLQKNEARIVLVDNNPLSFLANPSNGILVTSFYSDADDQTLPAVLELLDELDGHDDVRPHLDARFGLKMALEEVSKNGLP
eukprot:CAMPEP_0119014088 /NCGR_PEP_ID=MMETSP1176-20130426/9348_1 /TAXON_ID=265551 /ORGANISM="Synedropsis recta cf, Strain CCMP1620" /LENGTH=282 /DNA_ID=CAMNT_0006967227 /DNA_START=58 /DNA_END=906 /DNA_ORIENTATION=+